MLEYSLAICRMVYLWHVEDASQIMWGWIRMEGCITISCHRARPLLSGWLILYGGGGGGSEAKKKFVYLKWTSKFGPL